MSDVCSAFVTITDLYDGENGRGIASTSYLYIANDSSSAPAASSLDWTTWANAYADFGINNRYFWQKETITYTDGQNPEINVWLLSTYVKGDPGINGVSYWVDKSASIISKDTNNNDTLTPSSVNLTAMKNEGGTTAVFTAGTIKVWAGTDTSGTPYAQTTGSSGGMLSFNARAADTIYTIKLYNSSNVELDTETVPVVATGINATQYYSYLRYSPVASPTDSDWTTTPDSSTRYIGTYAGTTPISSLHANNFSWSKYIGDDATQFYTYVRYSAYDDGRDYSTTPNDYVGIYVGTESSPPAASNTGWHWTKFVGDPGTNAVVAVLTNDSAQVPTDKDGNVPAGTVYPSTTIELYSGATKITAVTYPTLTSADYSGCTISQSDGTVTIASMAADYATVNLKVTYNTVTYSKQFTVTRQKQGLTGSQGPQGPQGPQGEQGNPGTNGQDAISYWLEKSATIISKDTNNSDALNPQSVTVYAKKNVGGTTSDFTTGTITLYADGNVISPASSTSSSITFNTSASYSMYLIKLSSGSTELDAESIPVIATGRNGTNGTNGTNGRDGTNGTNGADAVVAVLTNDSAQIPADKDGNVPSGGYVTATTTIEVYSGGTKVTPTYGTHTASSGCTITQSGGTATVTGLSVDSATVTLYATYGSQTFSKVFTVTKQKQGLTGSQGPQGEKGDTGAQGEKGDKGDTGAQGPQGEKGDKGDTGVQGPQGEKGDKGDTGEQGPQGETGPQGPQGETGATGSQGPSGTPAYVWRFDPSAKTYSRNRRSSSDQTITLTADIQGYSYTPSWTTTAGRLSANTGSPVTLTLDLDNSMDTVTIHMTYASASLDYELKLSVVDKTYEPNGMYVGEFSSAVPSTPLVGNKFIEGDYFIATANFSTYSKGIPYEYTGSAWNSGNTVDTTSSSNVDKIWQCLGGMLKSNTDIPSSATALYGWFQTLGAQTAIIKSLFAQAITIMTSGYIKGGTRYKNDGTINNWSEKGFWFGADGTLRANLQSDNAGNTFVGTNVGTSTVISSTTGKTGNYNTAMGYGSLEKNTTGDKNVAIGYGTLNKNTTGKNNVAIGDSALTNNTTGDYNVGIGTGALASNTYGIYNVGIGYGAMNYTTYAQQNTAIGYGALLRNTSGSYNTAIGMEALKATTTGANNVAVGVSALTTNASGTQNTAVGTGALYSSTVNANTAIGYYALYSNTTGTGNTALGTSAGSTITTGTHNTAIGKSALSTVTTGGYNVGIGYDAEVYKASGRYQMNINDAIIHLEFNASRKASEIFTVLKTYFPSATWSAQTVNVSVGAMGKIDNKGITHILAQFYYSGSQSTITIYTGSSAYDLTSSSSTTYTGRTIITFVNPKLTDTDRDSYDCLS